MKALKIFSILTAMLLLTVSCDIIGGKKPVKISSFVVGSWHLTSYCNMEANVDLHITFRSDASFQILQRTNSMEYQQFSGRYEVAVLTNEENPELIQHRVNGIYSDGKAWANSYICSLDENGHLVMQSEDDINEVSVYEPTLMPKVAATRTADAESSSVKPL